MAGSEAVEFRQPSGVPRLDLLRKAPVPGGGNGAAHFEMELHSPGAVAHAEGLILGRRIGGEAGGALRQVVVIGVPLERGETARDATQDRIVGGRIRGLDGLPAKLPRGAYMVGRAPSPRQKLRAEADAKDRAARLVKSAHLAGEGGEIRVERIVHRALLAAKDHEADVIALWVGQDAVEVGAENLDHHTRLGQSHADLTQMTDFGILDDRNAHFGPFQRLA